MEQLVGFFGGKAPLIFTRAVSGDGVQNASDAIAVVEKELRDAWAGDIEIDDAPDPASQLSGVSAYLDDTSGTWAVVFMFGPPVASEG